MQQKLVFVERNEVRIGNQRNLAAEEKTGQRCFDGGMKFHQSLEHFPGEHPDDYLHSNGETL
ncbi:MAG TPA: hypothetical protein PLF96_11845 [Thermotogota bacterium]|nr:hypothetical protein [Thermotogota bacterium]